MTSDQADKILDKLDETLSVQSRIAAKLDELADRLAALETPKRLPQTRQGCKL